MTTINEKRKYEKPAMQVFELRQQPQILTTSAGMDVMLDEEEWIVTP